MNWRKHYDRAQELKEFLNRGGEKERNTITNIINESKVERETINRIKEIDYAVKILVFAEMWCPDCIVNIPALEIMKRQNSNIDYRILTRDDNIELLKGYEVEGRPRIPTFLIFNSDFNLIGTFIEKPAFIKEVETHGDQVNIIKVKKAYRNGEYVEETINEVLGKLM
jgi:hypothetical protein